MRIIGHMVTRNEAGRYLRAAVRQLALATGEPPIVYDDRSDDDTFEIAAEEGAICARRPIGVPSFAENEGAFRWMAWQYMEDRAGPTTDDWILCLDADEFLVTDRGDIHEAMREKIVRRESQGLTAVCFRINEVFGVDELGRPLIRVDGYWGTIEGLRLVRWRPGAEFELRKEASGSIPRSWGRVSALATSVDILHLGYARPDDRLEKYHRYRNGTGHNPRHVNSILEKPQTVPWRGTTLDSLGVRI